jgi:hypothetical protein
MCSLRSFVLWRCRAGARSSVADPPISLRSSPPITRQRKLVCSGRLIDYASRVKTRHDRQRPVASGRRASLVRLPSAKQPLPSGCALAALPPARADYCAFGRILLVASAEADARAQRSPAGRTSLSLWIARVRSQSTTLPSAHPAVRSPRANLTQHGDRTPLASVGGRCLPCRKSGRLPMK